MVPASFDESNDLLDKPPSMTRDECEPVSILRATTPKGHPVLISCWKLTRQELDEINKTGRLWLTIYGDTMPPVALDVKKWFKTESNDPRNEDCEGV